MAFEGVIMYSISFEEVILTSLLGFLIGGSLGIFKKFFKRW
jgi:hypothetical protein